MDARVRVLRDRQAQESEDKHKRVDVDLRTSPMELTRLLLTYSKLPALVRNADSKQDAGEVDVAVVAETAIDT